MKLKVKLENGVILELTEKMVYEFYIIGKAEDDSKVVQMILKMDADGDTIIDEEGEESVLTLDRACEELTNNEIAEMDYDGKIYEFNSAYVQMGNFDDVDGLTVIYNAVGE